MNDKDAGPVPPAAQRLADDRHAHTDRIIRWVFWIGLAAVIVWVFADLLIKH